jgi:hypothetical protein
MARRYTEYLDVRDLPEAVRNPKAHDDAAMAASIDRFGFVEPITMDERTGRLVSGHGRRTDIIRRLEAGQDPPEGVEVAEDGRWLVPVTRGWSSRSDAEAEAFVVAANRIGERGGWDTDLLGQVLLDLRAMEDGLEGVGYLDDELDALLVSSGALGAASSSFLDGIAGEGAPGNPMKRREQSGVTGGDAVDFRLPMTVPERDEAVLKLREAQRYLGTDSLAATLLGILRAWQPPT